MAISIRTEFYFEAAHQLNLTYESKCENLHGHSYKCAVTITNDTDELNVDGMIVDFVEFKKIIKEKEVDKLVLGLPKNMNGTIGERGEYILKFKELLQSELGYDVVLEDERLTTKVAENILINADMSRKKRKKVIDKMAATVILQGYLDRL